MKVENLSGGIKRLISIILTLIGNAKILVLDEPTSGLDRKSRYIIWDVINKLKS